MKKEKVRVYLVTPTWPSKHVDEEDLGCFELGSEELEYLILDQDIDDDEEEVYLFIDEINKETLDLKHGWLRKEAVKK